MMSTRAKLGAWVRCPCPRPAAATRLICLPHAGGAASFFREWGAAVADDVEVWAVQYPGRENRAGEACIDEMDVLVDAVLGGIDPLLDGRPIALFGHSMGASVAHELTRRLEVRQPGLVQRLFVSSRPGPRHQRVLATAVHLRDDDGLIAELGSLGGTTGAVLADPELRALLLPAIRSDYRLIERYAPASSPRLETPVVALTGAGDDSLDVAEVRAWSEATKGRFRLRVFAGGHFYLVPERAAVLAAIAEELS